MGRLFLSLSIAVIFCSCGRNSGIRTGNEVMVDEIPGQCPYLTVDSKGKAVLSWVRMNNDSSSSFCYAILEDGKTFSTTVVIPKSNNIQPHSENLPKIIFKPSGEIIALWGAANPNPENKYSGAVFYVQSFDDGKTWTIPKTVVNDKASFDQRYYDVALLPNGEVGMIWLDNRKTIAAEGSGVYFSVTKEKNGFQDEKLIGQPACECCRTVLFPDSKGNIHVVYRGIIEDSIRDMVHIVSNDGAKTFTNPKRISTDNWVINACPHTGPSITENRQGLHFTWFTGGNNKGCHYILSADNGNTYINHDRISSSGSHPQIASLNNKGVMIAWDQFVQPGSAPNKKIGVQLRIGADADGIMKYITSDSSVSAYPVISGIDENHCIVAYTVRKNDKNYIAYQVLNVK